MHRPFRYLSLLALMVLLTPLSGCKSNTSSQAPVNDKQRIEAAGRAAAAITASFTSELKGAYAGKTPPTINVHVGDVTLIGFDEAIDAEEWGMRETNIDNTGQPAAGKAGSGANAVDNGNRDPNHRTSRRVNLQKGGMMIVLSEDATPVVINAPATATNPAKPR